MHRIEEFAAPKSVTWDCWHDLRNVLPRGINLSAQLYRALNSPGAGRFVDASSYAREALRAGPTLKWIGYTAWLSLRALLGESPTISSITWITRLWRDISLFGLGTAIRNSGRVLNRRTVTVKIPGFGSILVRKGDSDYDAVVQTLGRHEYLVGKSVQDRINRRYQQILDTGKTPVLLTLAPTLVFPLYGFDLSIPKLTSLL